MAELLNPDLCVIGGGTSGIAAAESAASCGASVVLIERGRLGGAVLNTGSIPARALAAAAARAEAVRTAGVFGIGTDPPRINFRRLRDQAVEAAAAIRPRYEPAHFEALGIRLLVGEARFSDRRTVVVGESIIRPRRVMIATGATPVVPSIPGLDQVPYFTIDTILDNTRKLTHLVIIGGGAIALELAQAHLRLGAEVTVVEPEALLAGIDPELAGVVLNRLRSEGVAILAGASVASILPRSMGIGIRVTAPSGETMLDASHILVATGRKPNLAALDLEKAGIRRLRGDSTRLDLKPGGRTTNPRVLAIGDAAGGPQAGHAAVDAARAAVRSALFGVPARTRPERLPRIVYTDPEIALVGLSEEAARLRYGDRFVITRASFALNERARVMRETEGLVKLLTDPAGRVLGAGIVGHGAGELAALFAVASDNRLGLMQLLRTTPPHPTFSGILADLAEARFRSLAASPLVRRWLALNRMLP